MVFATTSQEVILTVRTVLKTKASVTKKAYMLSFSSYMVSCCLAVCIKFNKRNAKIMPQDFKGFTSVYHFIEENQESCLDKYQASSLLLCC